VSYSIRYFACCGRGSLCTLKDHSSWQGIHQFHEFLFPFHSIVYTFLQFLFYFIIAISLVPNCFTIKLLLGAFGVYNLKNYNLFPWILNS
jgi:hypothetical protein